jgi:GNAT superfamily N-acetyltransferase
MKFDCFECGASIAADDLEALGEVFLLHARAEHSWPYPDQAIRNYAEATQRLTGPTERLAALGPVEIHRVTDERIDDWLNFFDHDAFVTTPEWAACYCLAEHIGPEAHEHPHWTQMRDAMVARLRAAKSFGYLAYVDGRPGGWVNASRRADYAFADGTPDEESIVGVVCFVIAPPYRQHGLAGMLLDHVIAGAPERGAVAVEGYPFNSTDGDGSRNFRGARSMYEHRGFEPVEVRERDTVMRLRVDTTPSSS